MTGAESLLTLVGVNISGASNGLGSAIRLESGTLTVKNTAASDDYAYGLWASGVDSGFHLVGAELVGATYGLLAQTNAFGEVVHSDIEQSANNISVRVDTAAVVRIASSRVDGVLNASGTMTCHLLWDENFVEIASCLPPS